MQKIVLALTPHEQAMAIRDGRAMYDNKLKNGNLAPSVGTTRSALFYDILGLAGPGVEL